MDGLRWSRVFGDTLFAIGAIAFVVAIATLTIGRKKTAVVDERDNASLPQARTSRR